MRAYPTVFLLGCIALPAAAATCESLVSTSLPHTTITVAETVAAGAFTPPGGKPLASVPSFCRVAGVLKPSSDSDIQFEVWMPSAGWNGRYLGAGNGGYAGSIGYATLGDNIAQGYATSASDTGHRGEGQSAVWALGHPEKIVDFGHRAVHETAVTAKALIKAFYGNDPRKSYFISCSNGGRQALMEAQRYPQDYDGIVAGAPANYWTHLMSAFVWDAQALMAEPGAYIPAAKLPAIEAAAMAACDTRDGVKDGVIENPAACRVEPKKLLCQGAETDQCLTAPQVATLEKLYRGPGVFPGYPAGGEAHAAGWKPWVVGTGPKQSLTYAFGTQFFINMVYSNPSWDFGTYQVKRDTKLADERMAPILNATNPDLKPFRDRGGKLILYHGWSDAAIPASNTIDYYRSVTAKLGQPATESFVRLYMVPGMQHCSGGDAPANFGQGGGARTDAQHHVGKAIEEWVENGSAPASIIASGHGRTRPLCPYPQVAQYNGSGSTDDAANFHCAAR